MKDKVKLINQVSKDTLKMDKSITGRKTMTKTETLDRAKMVYKAMVADGVVVFKDGENEVAIRGHDGQKTIQYGDSIFSIQGTKRVKLIPVKAKSARPKRSKEPKPATSEVSCEKCGATFTRSKFAPNQVLCPDCRGTKKAPAEPQVKICDVCGEEFTASKFNPYITTCPDCKKKARSAKAKADRLAKKVS